MLKIYIDINYPKKLVDSLMEIHALQTTKRFELIHWTSQQISENEIAESIFLLVNYQKRGLEVSIKKHFEAGYRVIACHAGSTEKLDLFEFAMTVLRIWPRVVEVSEKVTYPFLYTFNYGGNRLQNAYKVAASTKVDRVA